VQHGWSRIDSLEGLCGCVWVNVGWDQCVLLTFTVFLLSSVRVCCVCTHACVVCAHAYVISSEFLKCAHSRQLCLDKKEVGREEYCDQYPWKHDYHIQCTKWRTNYLTLLFSMQLNTHQCQSHKTWPLRKCWKIVSYRGPRIRSASLSSESASEINSNITSIGEKKQQLTNAS